MRGAIKKARIAVTRGDTPVYPFLIPAASYVAGCKVFFAIKAAVDDDPLDTEAFARKTFTDADIVSTDADGAHYELAFVAADTFDVVPGVYRAEFQIVSSDGASIVTYPNPKQQILECEIDGDVNRRTA